MNSGKESLTKEQILSSIKTDPDFIRSAEFKNSLNELMERYPEGVSDSVIARVLMVNKEKVQEIYEASLKVLKAAIGDGLDE